jgi:hypothetical protein
MKKNNLLFILIFVYSFLNAQKEDIFNLSNSLKYADYLYKSAEYDLAIPEFKRILFINPLDQLSGYRIFDCFIQSGNYKSGIKYSGLYKKRAVFTDTLNVLQNKLFLLTRDYNSFHSILKNNKLSEKSLLFLNFSEQMFRYQWKNAREFLPKLEQYADFKQFVPIVNRTANIKYKSPALSFTMSAIIPGTGKIYSGYWKDGLFSLLFTGVSTWQSYRGFKQKGTSGFYGWFMAGIGLSFYTGNLYGSVKAANKRNHEYNHQIYNDFEEVFIDTYSHF